MSETNPENMDRTNSGSANTRAAEPGGSGNEGCGAESPLERIVRGLDARESSAGQWVGRCPAHEDTNPSLAISEGDGGKVLVCCRAGCSQADVIAALRERGLWEPGNGTSAQTEAKPASSPTPKPAGRLYPTLDEVAQVALRSATRKLECEVTEAARYPYRNAEGSAVAYVLRFESADDPSEDGGNREKTFRPIHAAEGGWRMGDPPEVWPMYRLPEICEGSCPIFVCEGEKAADAAATLFLRSTTSAHGSKSPDKTDWSPVSGRDVVILPDNDNAGRAYAHRVAELAHAAGAKSVKIVELPGLPEKGDIVEWIEAQNSNDPAEIREKLDTLVAEAGFWRPQSGGRSRPDPVTAAKSGHPYTQTDLGNAERLVARFGDRIRWDTAREAWRVWDGKRWALDGSLGVEALAAETVRKIREEAAAAPSSNGADSPDKGKKLFEWALKSESQPRISAMITLAKAQPGMAVTPDKWDTDPWVLNVANGTLDLRRGELRKHNPADMITKITAAAYEKGRRDERWERFLRDATGGNAEVTAFLQTIGGYILTGRTDEEIMIIVYGPEATGKTTFLEALRAILGDYARTISSDLLTRRQSVRDSAAASPDLAALAGVRLAAASEMDEGKQLAPALVKNLTGGDTITARHLYADLFEYQPQFKIVLALNHCPRVPADDGAMWRRLRRVGFEHTVPPERRDKTLKPYLKSPRGGGPAVLAWAVEGCLRWQREGLIVPAAVEKSTRDYREESDPLAEFFQDAVVFHENSWVLWADLYQAYMEHAREAGTPEKYCVTPKRIQERLKLNGCKTERRHAGRGWVGCELKNDWKTPPRDGVTPRDAFPESLPREREYGEVPEFSVTDRHTVTPVETTPEEEALDFADSGVTTDTADERRARDGDPYDDPMHGYEDPSPGREPATVGIGNDLDWSGGVGS